MEVTLSGWGKYSEELFITVTTFSTERNLTSHCPEVLWLQVPSTALTMNLYLKKLLLQGTAFFRYGFFQI